MYKGNRNAFGVNDLAAMEKRKSRTYIKTPDEVKRQPRHGRRYEWIDFI